MIYAAAAEEATVPGEGGDAKGFAQNGMVFLENWPGLRGKSLMAREPETLLRGNLFTGAETLRGVLRESQEGAKRGAPWAGGGLFGWVGFDGEFCFGLFREAILTKGEPEDLATARAASSGERPLSFVPQVTRGQFMERVRQAQEYIAAGDIYQVNLSYPWLAEWPPDLEPITFYRRLRQASPAPYAAYMDLGGTQVFSASPECFLQMEGRKVCTRPIKGTRPRSVHEASDAQLRTELVSSVKERAELVMITDLERNDLGRVCEFGSVEVTELLGLESFAQVHHLVSTVKGTLKEGMDHVDALMACFPGGSISGAPKKRALEIIHELESHPRGMYTGAIGCLGFHGESHFSIAIRTAWKEGSVVQFHTGAGIVADSVPEQEYEETRHKAAGLLKAAADLGTSDKA